jgi:hypothetical protein
LDFVREGLEGAALVRSSVGPVFLEFDDRLEAEGSCGNLWFEDPNEVGGGGLGEVNDDRLRGNRGVGLLTDAFGERGAGKTLF